MPSSTFESLRAVADAVNHATGAASALTGADSTAYAARKAAAASVKTTGSKRKKPVKAKAVPVCNAKDLRTKASKRRKCRVVKPTPPRATPVVVPTKAPTSVPSSVPAAPPVPAAVAAADPASPAGAIASAPVTTDVPGAFPTPPIAPLTDGLRTYAGPFGIQQAQRLLFRAGFGPLVNQASSFAAAGLEASVEALINPGPASLQGPAPSGSFLVDGHFAPRDLFGHLHLDMLDRQVRSTDSLTERLTLILHDWFGVSQEGAGYLVADHIDLLRRSCRGSMRQLLLDVTLDPAMLNFLNGKDNRKQAPNENYAREIMELFALGADRGAYTEIDVREMARCLTGFKSLNGAYPFDPTLFDNGTKTLFAGTDHQKSGNLGWTDAVNAVVDHPLHSSFVVLKLWSYFIPTAPTAQTQKELEALYRSSGERIEPLVKAILLHPDLHTGPSMVKNPVVLNASMLRALGRGITTDAWWFMSAQCGQMLGFPPNVSGWNDQAWLNTNTYNARWVMLGECLRPQLSTSQQYQSVTETPEQAVAAALAAVGDPVISDDLHAALLRFANKVVWISAPNLGIGYRWTFYSQRQNTLRQLIVASSDFQVS